MRTGVALAAWNAAASGARIPESSSVWVAPRRSSAAQAAALQAAATKASAIRSMLFPCRLVPRPRRRREEELLARDAERGDGAAAGFARDPFDELHRALEVHVRITRGIHGDDAVRIEHARVALD